MNNSSENQVRSIPVKDSIPKDLRINPKAGNMVRKAKKVYPNQPCTCGSGKKAKKCCYSPYK